MKASEYIKEHGDFEITEEKNIKKYIRPLSKSEVFKKYGERVYKKLIADSVHKFRMETGIELIHREPSKQELDRIWANWKLMSDADKSESDKKSLDVFGLTNKENYIKLISTYKEK